jgi:hypothetical protein
VTIGPTGQSVIIAFAFLNVENTTSVIWALECFHTVFKVKPAIFLTDSDASLIAAFEAVSVEGAGWFGVIHNLCPFHVSNNFWSHISPVVTDRAAFHAVTTHFWRVAKNTDSESRASFDSDWDTRVKLSV